MIPDVVVAGGGAAGLAAARELAGEGLRVLVLDPSDPPGAESAARAAAGMLALAEMASRPALADLGRAARDAWDAYAPALVEEAGIDLALRPGPSLLVGRDASEAADVAARVAALRAAGCPAEEVPPEEARRRVPALGGVAAAALLPRDGWLDNRALIDALAAACRRRGVGMERAAAARIGRSGGRAAAVVTRRGERRPCGAVVLAAGARLPEIDGVAPVPVAPIKGEMIALAAPCGRAEAVLPAVVRNPTWYLVPRRDRIAVGATVVEAGFETGVRADVRRDLAAFAASLVPALAGAREVEAWWGFRPATPDRLPAIGPLDLPNAVAVAGLHRHGILLAPVAGRAVADLVVHGRTDLPIDHFSPARFF